MQSEEVGQASYGQEFGKQKSISKRGLFRWVFGDGMGIKVFQDAWLRGKVEFRVDNCYSDSIGSVKASDLFIPGTKIWDTLKVTSLFSSCDAKAILATPVPQHQAVDHVVWTHTVDGKYAVKSGYHFWLNNSGNNRNRRTGWSELWKLEVPQKIKVFLWRFGRNNVSVRNLLRGKGVQLPIICPMCEKDVEHLLHLFFDCDFAKQCWSVVNLNFDMRNVENALDWLLQKL